MELFCIDPECREDSPFVCLDCQNRVSNYFANHHYSAGRTHKSTRIRQTRRSLKQVKQYCRKQQEKLQKALQVYFEHVKSRINQQLCKEMIQLQHRIQDRLFWGLSTFPEDISIIRGLQQGDITDLPKDKLRHIVELMSLVGSGSLSNPYYTNLEADFKVRFQSSQIQSRLQSLFQTASMQALMLKDCDNLAPEVQQKISLESNIKHWSEIGANEVSLIESNLSWGIYDSCCFFIKKNQVPVCGSQQYYNRLAHEFGKKILLCDPGISGNCFSSRHKQEAIYKNAQKITLKIKQKYRIPDIYNDLLVLQGPPKNWAHNAQSGSMNAFGGPEGDGFAYDRMGSQQQKIIHLFVFGN